MVFTEVRVTGIFFSSPILFKVFLSISIVLWFEQSFGFSVSPLSFQVFSGLLQGLPLWLGSLSTLLKFSSLQFFKIFFHLYSGLLEQSISFGWVLEVLSQNPRVFCEFFFQGQILVLGIDLSCPENPAIPCTRHSETLNSCFDLIRSHQLCIP